MSRTTSWRLAIRLARRDALRARGRSILVLVMIALPVLAVTAADVVIQTSQVSSAEGIDRRLGSADAQIQVPAGGAPMLQAFDPYDGNTSTDDGRKATPPSAAAISAALGGARLIDERLGELRLRSEHGVAYTSAVEVDLRDPITDGLFDLTSGRWPADPSEVVVNQAVLDKGYAFGDRLDLVGDGAPAPTIVGIAESAESRTSPAVAGPVGSLGIELDQFSGQTWLAAGGPVSWKTVQQLNTRGATVLSRAVITDPPPASEVPAEIRAWSADADDAMVAVVVLVVVMALLEVVLLAGPAFAVSARRQSRTLALMAATGGTPAQSRRVVIGGGLVLGTTAALVGVVLGIAVGAVAVPIVQHWSDTRFGPFEVPWLHLAGIALFGLLSAVLATVVPAWIASRQDVVAVLAGRRADRRPSLRSPIVGLVLLGIGIAGSAYGATSASSGEFAIAASAVVAVIGMIFLAPVVVSGVAKVAGRLPLSPRYAARDAARHRTRTVPAVAAVAATVAGVVALGIALTSDEAENKGTYQAQLPYGMGSVTAYSDDDKPVDWTPLRAAAERELPDATVVEVRGLLEGNGVDTPSYWLEISTSHSRRLLESYGSSWGSSTLVSGSVADLPVGMPADYQARAAKMLADGGIVAFTDQGVTDQEARLTLHRSEPDSVEDTVTRADVPALLVPVARGTGREQAILSPAAAKKVGAPVGVAGLAVTGTMTPDQQQAADEALRAASANASIYVERGYQADDETVIAQLVLAALGGVLMLGGTLTATFLALSDARPDLATLAAVGASPRRRRSIAASYALVIGLVGAVLGAAVGFIPGIAVTYPLTRGYSDVAAHYLDVPWLMILGLVVGLPLLTAAIVGLCARSRLPLVARLD
jgi:putative ABC transport system permease protein